MYKIICVLLLSAGILSLNSCEKKASAGAPGADKAREGYLAINKAFESGDASVLDKHVVKDAIGHSPMDPEPKRGIEEAKKFFNAFHNGFPDAKIEIKTTAVSGDTLFGLYHMTATNTGEMMGMPATNKKIDIWGVDVMRFNADGMMVEHWDFGDNVTFMKQLGLIPDMAAAMPPPTSDSTKTAEKK